MQAHSNATNAIGCIAPKPGRRMISMPSEATPTAVQRRIPTFSPSSGTESAVTISGDIARIACASASGSTVMVRMNSPISTISMNERRPCSQKRRVIRPLEPWRAASQPETASSERKRTHRIWMIEYCSASSLLPASMQANSSQAASAQAMPRPVESAAWRSRASAGTGMLAGIGSGWR
jgi:hypothetical protein